MSRNQASCSVRLLTKQLCHTLPSLFSLRLVFYFVCCRPLSFKASLHQRFTTRPNGCRESCSGVNWSVSARLKPANVLPATQLVKSPEASFRTISTSLVSTANQLIATSPIAKKSNIEQPIGTCTVIGWKCLSQSESRAKERSRSLVFFQTTWITKCWKVIMEFLPDDTKNKLPTSALKSELQWFSPVLWLKSLTSTELIFPLLFAVIYSPPASLLSLLCFGTQRRPISCQTVLSVRTFIFQNELMFIALGCRGLYSNLLQLITAASCLWRKQLMVCLLPVCLHADRFSYTNTHIHTVCRARCGEFWVSRICLATFFS